MIIKYCYPSEKNADNLQSTDETKTVTSDILNR